MSLPLVLAPAARAETWPTVAGSHDLSYDTPWDDRTRSYRLHLPTGFSPTDGTVRPIVVALHGGSGNPSQFETQSLYSAKADANDFIVVYPKGTGVLPTWNASLGCCGYANNQNVDDVRFLKDLVARLSGVYAIDANKVFATGHSNGAIMSYRLACDASDVFVAVGVNAGDSTTLHRDLSPCDLGGNTVPIVNLHGDADTNEPYMGGAGSGFEPYVREPVEDPDPDLYGGQTDIGQWTALNGCSFVPISTVSTADYVKKTFCGTSGLQIINYKVLGGVHAWYTVADDGISSTDVTWDFFAAHGATPQTTVTIDQAVAQEDPSDESTLDFTVTFSEAVTGFTGADVLVSGPAGGTYAPSVSGSGSSYTVAVAIGGTPANGVLTATIPAAAATSASGTPTEASTSTDNSITIDRSRPAVVINQEPSQEDPSDEGVIDFSVTFSEPVTGFTASDVLVSGPAGGSYAASISGGGPSYSVDVAVTGTPAPGPLTASIVTGAAADAAGNTSTASTSTDNTVSLAPAPVTLFSEGFESGSFTAGGWTTSGSPVVATSAAHVGSYGGRLRSTSSITRLVSTVGYATVTVNYDRVTSGLDSGENLYVEWSTNGTTWNLIETTQQTSWSSRSFVLPSGAGGQSGFRLRFRTNAGQVLERADLDAITILGH